MKYIDFPIYSNNSDIISKRKNHFIEIGKQIYPNLKSLTCDDYLQIVNDFNDGNLESLNKLLELIIRPTIDVLANIYAKYDIEGVISFEDSLSYSLSKIINSLKSFKTLPKSYWYFKSAVINVYVYNSTKRLFSRNYVYNEKYEEIQPSSIVYEIDKREHEDFDNSILINEARERIIKVMSKLKDRDARILALRFGFHDNKQMTFEEIAKKENLCRARVQQIVSISLKRIRKPKNIALLKMYKDSDFNLV